MIRRAIIASKIRYALWSHKVSLLLLKSAFDLYKASSTKLIQNIPVDARWESGIEDDQTRLDAAYRVVCKRIQTTVPKKD